MQQETLPPTDPDAVDLKTVPKTLPKERAGIARLRGRMLKLLEESFVKLNTLVPEKDAKVQRGAVDDRKTLEAAEDLVRTMSRAKAIVGACDALLAAPGATTEPSNPAVP
jgi:hypothetical protein